MTAAEHDSAAVDALRGMDEQERTAWVPAFQDHDVPSRADEYWHHTARFAGGQRALTNWMKEEGDMPNAAPKIDPGRTKPGSVQCVLVRWTRDDGVVYVSKNAVLGEVTTEGARPSVMFQSCVPDPEFDAFALGATTTYDSDGLVTCAHPELPSEHEFVAEFWSLAIDVGAPIGYFRWTLPRCSDVRFTGANLNGKDVTLMEYRARLDAPLTYSLTMTLPVYTPGLTQPEGGAETGGN